MATYRFTTMNGSRIDKATVQTVIEEVGGQKSAYNYAVNGSACNATGPALNFPKLQVDARRRDLNVQQLVADLAAAGAGDAPSTEYKVNLNMSTDTTNDLQTGGYQMYGFKAITGGGGGEPVVWFSTTTYSTNTLISWSEQYAAYISLQTDISNNVTIEASNTVGMSLGDVFTVTNPDGTGPAPVSGGQAGSISIIDHAKDSSGNGVSFSCGIAQLSTINTTANPATPTCVFPLYGGGEDVLTPVEMVLLVFATQPYDAGTVIEQAFSAGFLIDLTDSAPSNERSVTFDMNNGWATVPANQTWGTNVPAGQNIVSLLINPSDATKPPAEQLAAAQA